MASKLRPGKGAHLHLNGDTLKFLNGALDEISSTLEEVAQALDEAAEHSVPLDEWDAINTAIDEHSADVVFKALRKELEAHEAHDWHFASDNFGKKLYCEMEWKRGTYRVTIVLTDNGGLKLDIREWYVAED